MNLSELIEKLQELEHLSDSEVYVVSPEQDVAGVDTIEESLDGENNPCIVIGVGDWS